MTSGFIVYALSIFTRQQILMNIIHVTWKRQSQTTMLLLFQSIIWRFQPGQKYLLWYRLVCFNGEFNLSLGWHFSPAAASYRNYTSNQSLKRSCDELSLDESPRIARFVLIGFYRLDGLKTYVQHLWPRWNIARTEFDLRVSIKSSVNCVLNLSHTLTCDKNWAVDEIRCYLFQFWSVLCRIFLVEAKDIKTFVVWQVCDSYATWQHNTTRRQVARHVGQWYRMTIRCLPVVNVIGRGATTWKIHGEFRRFERKRRE
jgi:hypothetical protein